MYFRLGDTLMNTPKRLWQRLISLEPLIEDRPNLSERKYSDLARVAQRYERGGWWGNAEAAWRSAAIWCAEVTRWAPAEELWALAGREERECLIRAEICAVLAEARAARLALSRPEWMDEPEVRDGV